MNFALSEQELWVGVLLLIRNTIAKGVLIPNGQRDFLLFVADSVSVLFCGKWCFFKDTSVLSLATPVHHKKKKKRPNHLSSVKKKWKRRSCLLNRYKQKILLNIRKEQHWVKSETCQPAISPPQEQIYISHCQAFT